LGYDKCEDADFVWSEFKKVFGPAVPDQRLLGLQKENQRLHAQIDEIGAARLGPLSPDRRVPNPETTLA
jgi:hypothetical protein